MKIAEYIGKDVSRLLTTDPFIQWEFERSTEDELDEPIMHYEFHRHGLELRCDANDRISVIFVFLNVFGRNFDWLLGISRSSSRKQVRALFGHPATSGEASVHPVLGAYCAWDRFTLPSYIMRFEYSLTEDEITKITFMRTDVVP